MARFRVLPDVLGKFQALASLDSTTVRELCLFLDTRLKVKLSPEEDLANALADYPPLGFLEDVKKAELVSSIIGAHVMRYSSGRETEELIADLTDAAQENPEFESFSRENFQANLEYILNIWPLQTSIKAWVLVDEYEHIFLDAKIFSEIRPIFNNELESPLRASLVMHTVKITHRKDGRREPIYITADAEDLRILKENIERALKKDAALKAIIQKNSDFGEILPGEVDD